MIYGVFAVYDTAVKAYMRPVFVRNAGEARRAFSEEINTSNTVLNRYPSDYVLFDLGFWNDDTGEFSSHKAPVRIAVGSELVSKSEKGE